MAEWDRNKVSPSEINNGKQFTTDDDLTVEELNAMVNNSFYGVDFAENMADQPDISEINSSGSPEVSIIDNVKNGITYKKFKFKNLKGEKGADGTIGKNGKSAYEYAKDGGYTGTEQEFASELADIQNKYEKPSDGIPKTDLSSDVQTSLGKADTALQSVPEEYAKTSDIPIVSDETILITQGGNFKGSFTLNQSSGVHIDLDAGGSGESSSITIDDYLSETSTNPVQNRVINSALSNVTQNMNLLNTHKANADATNLTELNIAAWKEKLKLGLPLGMIISSAFVQNDAGLHLLDGGELDIGGTYDAFCQFVINKYNADNTSIPVTDLETYKTELETYGQCGKFVITDTYIKLPTIKKFIEGISSISDIGTALGAGLPNIEGHFNVDRKSDNTTLLPNSSETAITTGAMYAVYQGGSGTHSTASSSSTKYTADDVIFDASRSNIIYGNSDTVQPQSIKYPYYIVVATVTKTDIEVNIDNIATDLNNKLSKTETVRYPVSKWISSDGMSWYTIYSDDWKECGGTSGTSSTTTQKAITFPLPNGFDSISYTLVLGGVGQASTGSYEGGYVINSKTKTGFTHHGIASATNSYNNFDWFACGY